MAARAALVLIGIDGGEIRGDLVAGVEQHDDDIGLQAGGFHVQSDLLRLGPGDSRLFVGGDPGTGIEAIPFFGDIHVGQEGHAQAVLLDEDRGVSLLRVRSSADASDASLVEDAHGIRQPGVTVVEGVVVGQTEQIEFPE